MNFAVDTVERQPPDRLALVELSRDGARRTWTFSEVADRSARLAGTLVDLGVCRGDIVMTLIGNRPEWVFAMVACFRIGAVALPCTEQLRPKDLAARLTVAHPSMILCDERNGDVFREALAESGLEPIVRYVPDESLYASQPAPAADLAPEDDCLVTFTSGTTGLPKAVVHGQRYLPGQALQAEHWLGARTDDVVWCTAASGWSKSARNVFIAPWLRGATAVLHDARFDPSERLELVDRERVNVLCMAPTEYRVIAKRAELRPLPSIRELVAAGEALNPEVIEVFRAATGVSIRDGFGQTETGQLTGVRPGVDEVAGSMGRPLPSISAWVDRGELVVDPSTVPTFFVRYLDGPAPPGPWRTGDLVRADAEGYLFFEGRSDDVIVSSGYRIGPHEVESALMTHPAVVDAAAVAAPDRERGSIVRAVVVLRGDYTPSEGLARALQDHVKAQTAPYKYPRIVEFVTELPKTSTGKVRRGVLRAG